MAAAFSSTWPLVICTLLLILTLGSSSSPTVQASMEHQHLVRWMPSRSEPCKGTIAECLAAAGEEEEFQLDSEISRRILARNRYISYGALRRNTVPCSRRGASYYNCRAGGQANPYNRGCNAITRCRR